MQELYCRFPAYLALKILSRRRFLEEEHLLVGLKIFSMIMLEFGNLWQGYDTICYAPQTHLCLILRCRTASLCKKIWQSYAKKHKG